MTEEQFIKRMKGYKYVWKLLSQEEVEDLIHWIYRQFKKKLEDEKA
jgi:hypothetical protein